MIKAPKIRIFVLTGLALLGTFSLAAFLWLASGSTARSQEAFTPEEKKELGEFVREYLIRNPKVIVEAIQELRRRQAAATQARVGDTIAAMSNEVFASESSPVGGNPDGDVTLVEFFDYNCPYCRAVKPTVFEVLKSDGKLRFVYKEFPILGESSVFAAKAALAANRRSQDLYEELHNRLLDAKGRLTEESVLAVAADIGLDVARLRKDMEDPAIQTEIDRNKALAQRLGITGTPAFVVGREILPGAQSGPTLRQAIRRVREQG